MFDWDKDQESLLATPVKARDPADAPALAGLRRKITMGAFGLLVMLGFAYEKDMLPQLQEASVLGVITLDHQSTAPLPGALPDGLVAYDAAQARQYLHGLRLADAATLQGYAARLRADLVQAGPALAPFFRDAERLVAVELARRAD